MTGFDIEIITPRRFSIAKGRAKSIVLTPVCPLEIGSIAGHWILKSYWLGSRDYRGLVHYAL